MAMNPIKVHDLLRESAREMPPEGKQYVDFFLIAVTDFSCSNCNSNYLVLASTLSPRFPADISYLCFNCFGNLIFANLSMEHQALMSDRFKTMNETGIDKVSKNFSNFLSVMRISEGMTSSPDYQNDFEVGDVPKGASDAPIPPGYRSIAWIRAYEADALIYCYKNKKNFELKNSSEEVIFRCLYFEDISEEYRKFKANVQAIRITGENHRVIGWIRQEEARAILESDKSRSDVDFAHIKIGNGGLVQFFGEDLEVAKKYRSTTRLLRKD